MATLKFNVNIFLLKYSWNYNLYILKNYIASKSFFIYIACFPLFILECISFIFFSIPYGILSGILHIQENESSLIDFAIDINNIFLKILVCVPCFIIDICLYFISIIFSLPAYIISYLFAIFALVINFPFYKMILYFKQKKL